ncbi:hypothetical protein [Falsiroseomonas sp.]|uniref:hypothetical protein n=1 Tax=Falsiroseomonas sp. TaxID=2870721 RepID=UPI0027166C26|nr:hypothetical protein [Falsiroseomonas sp.]MDO9501063.1 hypothetical protein [Falsiroseomonas sp.]
MARNIGARVESLRKRRTGLDRIGTLAQDAQREVLAKSLITEQWQRRTNKQYTQYTLGAMQEVGPDYTRISITTAERVANQLSNNLTPLGIAIDFRLQGSVPLNVHIRGVSDVDLLNLDNGFFTYERTGIRSQFGLYRNPSEKSSLGVLLTLRQASEKVLKDKFPAAVVDTSGGKAIKVSGGSLARSVDVVPSHWHDTEDYQASQNERDRSVIILDKKTLTTHDNLPFLHMARIEAVDLAVAGSLKKAIRLCKNVKSDAEDDGQTIPLPSFDIASTMYYADRQALIRGQVYDLAVLAETQRHFDELARNHERAKQLLVPDGSRRIFNTDQKLRGLNRLSAELDDLTLEVAKEHAGLLAPVPNLSNSRSLLSNYYLP